MRQQQLTRGTEGGLGEGFQRKLASEGEFQLTGDILPDLRGGFEGKALIERS